MARAWESWASRATAQQGARERVTRQLLSYWRGRRRCGAWQAWIEMVERRWEKHEMLARALWLLETRLCRWAWAAWRAAAADRREQAEIQAAVQCAEVFR